MHVGHASCFRTSRARRACGSSLTLGKRMSASNYSWVCFECRLVVRQPKTAKRIPKCLGCGSECYCLGYKVEVPKKEDLRSWRKLREDCRARELARSDAEAVAKVRGAHEAERRIAELLALPANRDRSKLIAELKKTPNQSLEPTPGLRPVVAHL